MSTSQSQMLLLVAMVTVLAVVLTEGKDVALEPNSESADALETVERSGPSKRGLGGGGDRSRFGNSRVLNGANMQNWRAFFDRPERAFGGKDQASFGRMRDEDLQKWQDIKRMADMSRSERAFGRNDHVNFGKMRDEDLQKWQDFKRMADMSRSERAFGRNDHVNFGKMPDEDLQKWQDFKRMVDMSRRERLRQYGY